ncbi:hypothetical protein QYF36_022682 [Acer negundo]|nr:hypothetical protein QYF36_022682 [Acer negundo]
MFPMVTGFMNYGQQTVRAARYIGQSFMITLSQANRFPVTIQYPYEKLITSERFRGRIHFEFDKCIACEVCVRVCPIDLPVVDWKLETDIRKKRLLNYSIDFGICIFCGNCVEYCPTNCLSMTEEYELATYDRHELNYNQIALGRLPMSVIDDFTIRTVLNSSQRKNGHVRGFLGSFALSVEWICLRSLFIWTKSDAENVSITSLLHPMFAAHTGKDHEPTTEYCVFVLFPWCSEKLEVSSE